MPLSSAETPETSSVLARVGLALRAAIRTGYGARQLRGDVVAGLTVGIVALPLAIALSIASGVPPQHGLYSSIVVGAIAAAAGGSRVMVTGTTAAFVVLLAPVAHRYGVGGLMIASSMAGVILIVLGLARLGRLIQFIPHPVTTGFTAGIGVVIGGLQIKDFFGLTTDGLAVHFPDRMIEYGSAFGTMQPWELAVGAFTLAVLVVWPKISRKIPSPLVAITLAALVVWWMSGHVEGFHASTIGSRYGGIPHTPPAFAWPWNQPDANGHPIGLSLALVRELLSTSFAMAALGAIVSLMCAVVADGMAGTRHDSNVELVGQGLGNLIGPFFGGFAATGAIARTATGIRAGAVSPISAITHSVFLLLAVLLLAPLLYWLPMAGLAALLLVVAWNMSAVGNFVHLIKVAPRSDVLVLLTCFTLTVVFDMTLAVTAGIVLAALLFMQRMSDMFHAKLDDSHAEHLANENLAGVVFYEIRGPLFFGAAEKAVSTLARVNKNAKAVILQMDDVPVMDITGLVALESAIQQLHKARIFVAIAGVQPQPREVLDKAGIHTDPAWIAVCDTDQQAIAAVRKHLESHPKG